MKKITELNREIPEVNSEELDVMISELVEREEFACTGHITCGANACAVYDN